MTMQRFLAGLLVAAAWLGSVQAAPVTRREWVPGNGSQGDLWTFSCPGGGHFTATVDNLGAALEPYFSVSDGTGGFVAFADDDVPCTFPPTCGFACPQVVNVPCGSGSTHSIRIAAATSGGGCETGAGYVLTLEVFNSGGASIDPKQVKLGGGAKRKVPSWYDPDRLLQTGPALDDE